MASKYWKEEFDFHDKGYENCEACRGLNNYPKRCECGGLIHTHIWEGGLEWGYLYCCEKCNSTENIMEETKMLKLHPTIKNFFNTKIEKKNATIEEEYLRIIGIAGMEPKGFNENGLTFDDFYDLIVIRERINGICLALSLDMETSGVKDWYVTKSKKLSKKPTRKKRKKSTKRGRK